MYMCVFLGSPETDTEMRIHVQVMYEGYAPGQTLTGVGNSRTGKRSQSRGLFQATSQPQPGSTGTSGV